MNSILKYNQAKMRIFQLIADQHLKIGDRLPPERDLCLLYTSDAADE